MGSRCLFTPLSYLLSLRCPLHHIANSYHSGHRETETPNCQLGKWAADCSLVCQQETAHDLRVVVQGHRVSEMGSQQRTKLLVALRSDRGWQERTLLHDS